MPGGGSAAAGSSRSACSRSTSRIFGTQTITEIAPFPDAAHDVVRVEAAHEDDGAVDERRDVRRHRLAEHVAERQQVQEADRQERPRVGLYFATSFATGTMLASMLRWRMTTPFGLGRGAGGEDDLAMSSRVIGRRASAVGAPVEIREAARRALPGQAAGADLDVVADEDDWRRDDAGDRRRSRRRAVVDRDDDDAGDARRPSSTPAIPRRSRPRAASCRPRRARPLPAGRKPPRGARHLLVVNRRTR